MIKNKRRILIFFLSGFSIVNFILILLLIHLIFFRTNTDQEQKNQQKIVKDIENNEDNDRIFIDFLDSLNYVNDSIAKGFSGNKVSILITGLDSRIGTKSNHADANHLLNIWLDSGKIEIISIPRGTFCDAGLSTNLQYDPDDTTKTTNLNYLANVRSTRGRDAYHKAVSKIAKAQNIDYYIEFGFSQALGILELLGYQKNSVQILRTLRSRKSFSVGDYQRCYNQGQFIRQIILKHFYRLDELLGKSLLKGALFLVESNLSYEDALNIVAKLKEQNFPRNSHDVIVRLKPGLSKNISNFNFTENNSLDSLYKMIVNKSKYHEAFDTKANTNDYISEKVELKLNQLIKKAIADTAKYPSKALNYILIPFEQRAWYQVSNPNQRAKIRNDILNIVYSSALKTNKKELVEKVNIIRKTENVLDEIKHRKVVIF